MSIIVYLDIFGKGMDDGSAMPGGFGGFGGMPGGFGGMPGGFGGIRMGGMPGGSMGGGSGIRSSQPSKSAAVSHNLSISLEDLYTGTTKRVRITKKIMDASGASTKVAVEKEIPVKAGWKDGTKITFEREVSLLKVYARITP